jgi:hypothetical protein
MTYKRRLFFNSIILFLAAVIVGSMILPATSSLARGGGGGSVRHSGGGRGGGSVHHPGSAPGRRGRAALYAIIEERQEPVQNYNRQSAAIGSVYLSSNYTRDKAPTLMTMSYRPGDGVSFSAEAKKYLEVVRKSNIDNSLQTITKELHCFLENNWPGWRSNWGGYYINLSIIARVGSRVGNLPEQHEIIKIKDSTYYYAGGVYYTKFRDIYVVVPPPHGAIIGTMPSEYTTVYVDNTAYFNGSNRCFHNCSTCNNLKIIKYHDTIQEQFIFIKINHFGAFASYDYIHRNRMYQHWPSCYETGMA